MTPLVPDDSKPRETPDLDGRADRIHFNIAQRIPSGAQLAYLGSASGDLSTCDGCGTSIDEDEVAYVLEFRQYAASVTLRLHPDCWECWRNARADALRVQRRPQLHARATRRHRP